MLIVVRIRCRDRARRRRDRSRRCTSLWARFSASDSGQPVRLQRRIVPGRGQRALRERHALRRGEDRREHARDAVRDPRARVDPHSLELDLLEPGAGRRGDRSSRDRSRTARVSSSVCSGPALRVGDRHAGSRRADLLDHAVVGELDRVGCPRTAACRPARRPRARGQRRTPRRAGSAARREMSTTPAVCPSNPPKSIEV